MGKETVVIPVRVRVEWDDESKSGRRHAMQRARELLRDGGSVSGAGEHGSYSVTILGPARAPRR